MTTKLTSKNGKIWTCVGKLIYLIGWPAIYFIIRLSPQRTRILVLSEGKLLLTKDWIGTGSWSIPGGGLHVNENPVNGALRELKEETGLNLKSSDLQKLGNLTTKNNGINTKLIVYKTEFLTKPKVIINGNEIIDFTWVGSIKLKRIPIDGSTSQIIDSFPSVSSLIQ